MKQSMLYGAVVFTAAIVALTFFLLRSPDTNNTAPDFPSAHFYWFEYEGRDPTAPSSLSQDEYLNPILAGFYPDPSIIRVEDDFYMVNSSFAYYPGVPLFHSKNLVDWTSLGYVLDRPSQLPIHNVGTSRGIFAPTIRHHNGTFYMITTNVEGPHGNFMVTTQDPAGDWSDPILLPEIQGIDPSIFFDDDGRVYITHNGESLNPQYEGHRAIWMWEFDLSSQRVIRESGRIIVDGGSNIEDKPIWIEGPHIYKHNDWYYLLCAEGGTADQHSQVAFRTRSLDEPFQPYINNPILTQRTLPANRVNPIAATGHADMVQLENGDWWAVFLGVRPYDGERYHLGRETFLLPVTWIDEWPVILADGEVVPKVVKRPLTEISTPNFDPMTGTFSWRDDFNSDSLLWRWNYLRTPNPNAYSWIGLDGLAIKPNKSHLKDLDSPSFIGARLQHYFFKASTSVAVPSPGIKSGLALYQSEGAYLLLTISNEDDVVQLDILKQQGKTSSIVTTKRVTYESAKNLILSVEGENERFIFTVQSRDKKILMKYDLEAKFLSTTEAGGFVGSYIGLFAGHDE